MSHTPGQEAESARPTFASHYDGAYEAAAELILYAQGGGEESPLARAKDLGRLAKRMEAGLEGMYDLHHNLRRKKESTLAERIDPAPGYVMYPVTKEDAALLDGGAFVCGKELQEEITQLMDFAHLNGCPKGYRFLSWIVRYLGGNTNRETAVAPIAENIPSRHMTQEAFDNLKPGDVVRMLSCGMKLKVCANRDAEGRLQGTSLSDGMLFTLHGHMAFSLVSKAAQPRPPVTGTSNTI